MGHGSKHSKHGREHSKGDVAQASGPHHRQLCHENLGMSQKLELELLETSPIFKILVFQLKPRLVSS